MIAITGGYGFLGWHVACRLRAHGHHDLVRLGRDDFADPARLRRVLAEVDTLVHVAGVNRAEDPAEVEQANVDLARTLADALPDRPVHVVYANSIQIDHDNPYGRGKAEAGAALAGVLAARGGTLADVQLPNLFGEHGRPHYNSFTATFCHEVATGGEPVVTGDRPIPLLHAQDAAEALHRALEDRSDATVRPHAEERRISEVLETIKEAHRHYVTGEIPPLDTPFQRDIFNTYRSFTFPDQFPLHPQLHADPRGELCEVVRSHGGTGMAFASLTRPGQTRGDHYHLRKVERFAVVSGSARIRLRRLFSDDVVAFDVEDGQPAVVDMPTMWVHNITNTGDRDLVTAFWADQLLDRENPDQFPELVEVRA